MADLKKVMQSSQAVLQRNKHFTADDIQLEMKTIIRKETMYKSNYDKMNLTDVQVDKLLTQHYDLKFLEDDEDELPGRKPQGTKMNSIGKFKTK